MAARNRLRQLVGLLPEVVDRRAAPVLFRHKAVYTATSVLIFLAGSRLPLYGIDYRSTTGAPDPFYWIHAASAFNRGTLMTLGVYPVLISEMLVHALLGHKIAKLQIAEEQRMRLIDRLQQMLSIVIAMLLAISNVMSMGPQLGTGNATLVALQLFVGGVIIIYLDQAHKRGYGLVSSGISLFTTINICASFLWGLVYGDVLGGGKVPLVTAAAGTCAFLVLIVRLQGMRMALAVRTRRKEDIEAPMTQANCTINLSYLSYAPIIFQGAIVSSAYLISQRLYLKYGENNKLCNLLGKWKLGNLHRGEFIPVSGVAYYITTPPSLADLAGDPAHVIIYAILLLMGCATISAAWFIVRVYSKTYVAWLLGKQISVAPAQPGSIPLNRLKRHVAMVAFLVGFCVGALSLMAGFMGVVGSGTGIMLVVTVVNSYFERRAENQAGDAFCL